VRKSIVLLAVVALTAALAAPAAKADSDPASDTLLVQDAYLPVEPPLGKAYQDAIRHLAVTTRKARYIVKVAIIATPNDLGLVPQLFNKPQNYAAYLGREISFNTKNPLLVVMPAGYGVYNTGAREQAAIKGLKPPGSSLDALGKAALDGMARMATAAGHPVQAPAVKGSGGGGGTSPAVIFGVPVVLLALAGLLASLKRRGSEEEEHQGAAAP
jgi:hypothetical protein